MPLEECLENSLLVFIQVDSLTLFKLKQNESSLSFCFNFSKAIFFLLNVIEAILYILKGTGISTFLMNYLM